MTAKRKTSPWRRGLGILVKAAVSLALLVIMALGLDVQDLLNGVKGMAGPLALASVLLVAIQFPLAAWRWQRVTLEMGQAISVGVAYRYMMIGQFFNQCLPSSIGGDVFRVWLLHRRNMPLSQALGGVFLDRVIGTVTLAVTAMFGLPALFQLAEPSIFWMVLSLCSVVCGGYVAFLALGWAVTRGLFSLPRILSPIVAAAQGGCSMFESAPRLLFILLQSIAIHGLIVVVAVIFLRGLGVTPSFMHLVALVPPVFLVALLPISLAGWGVREGAMVVSLGLIGIAPEQAFAVSLLTGVALLIASLPGALFWLFEREGLRGAERIVTAEEGQSSNPGNRPERD